MIIKQLSNLRFWREAVRSVKARIKLGDSVVQLDDIIDKLESKMSLV